MKPDGLQQLLFLGGLAQIEVVFGSLAVPPILGWRTELSKVRPLIRQIFWTYAGYILVINLCFGLVSVFDAAELVNGTRLAALVSSFIAVYWISRVSIQFFYFDRSGFPAGKWPLIGEITLVTVFIFLSAIYSLVCYHNLTA